MFDTEAFIYNIIFFFFFFFSVSHGIALPPVFETHAGPSARDHQLWRRSSNSSEFVARRSTKCFEAWN